MRRVHLQLSGRRELLAEEGGGQVLTRRDMHLGCGRWQALGARAAATAVPRAADLWLHGQGAA